MSTEVAADGQRVEGVAPGADQEQQSPTRRYRIYDAEALAGVPCVSVEARTPREALREAAVAEEGLPDGTYVVVSASALHELPVQTKTVTQVSIG